jgi:hypothetical protein
VRPIERVAPHVRQIERVAPHILSTVNSKEYLSLPQDEEKRDLRPAREEINLKFDSAVKG